jgi:predicted transcriptional regulator
MKATTIRVDISTHDRLASIADGEFHSASLGEAVQRLVDEHEMQTAHAAYARLRNDQEAWAAYRGELAHGDVVAGDGLGPAGDEYPAYNQ